MSTVFASNGSTATEFVDGFLDETKEIPDSELKRDVDCIRTGAEWTCIPTWKGGNRFHLPLPQVSNPWMSLVNELEIKTGRTDLVIVTY